MFVNKKEGNTTERIRRLRKTKKNNPSHYTIKY